MRKKLFMFIILLFFSTSLIASPNKDLTKRQLLCPKLLWGFDFFSSNKVRVIGTDLNNKTEIKEYFYGIDIDLSYVNIYINENNLRDRVYSVELNTLRVDIWTMTGGGFTTREMFPVGFCEFIKINNLFSHIQSLKIIQ